MGITLQNVTVSGTGDRNLFQHRPKSDVANRFRCNSGPNRGERGYIFATLAIALVALIGCIGLAVDLGMLYIYKAEAQNFVDSAALGAAMELDGTVAGISAARARVAANQNQWGFGSNTFGTVITEFAQSPSGPWESSPGSPLNYAYARVTTNFSSPLMFLHVVVADRSGSIATRATAAQLLKTAFDNGVFPYSPFVHNPSDPDFGFTKGTTYTLRWPNNMNPSKANGCPADEANPAVMQMKLDSGDAIQGFIDDSSASYLREAVINDERHVGSGYTIGTPLFMATGNKQTEGDAVATRVNQDTDKTSATYTEYRNKNAGSGRRLVIVPVNGGPANNFKIIGFAAFFLLTPKNYLGKPQDPFCAEYVGSTVIGGDNGGASGVPGGACQAL